MKDFWNLRYQEEGYAYGIDPNTFFKDSLEKLNLSGRILLPAEGEGRNAVYAAKKGLEVHAFDLSEAGKSKAERLAKQEGVTINYEVGELEQLELSHKTYNAAALIFAHFPPPILQTYHQKIATLIQPNGILLLEGFSKDHLEIRQANPQVGGPRSLEMLFSKDQIREDFVAFDPLVLEEVEVELKEGKYHNGIGKVVRFIGRKK
ncbi:MAG: class I SAM-dependent methyltransferase [Saprospiraceae bacterium]